MVPLLHDPNGDRRGLLRDGEALAEAVGEGFQQWTGQLADGVVQRMDRGCIEGEQPWILLGCRGSPMDRGSAAIATLSWC